MPRRTDIQRILLIGAGPIVIGQACEFDYSGTQGAKALREEGLRRRPRQLEPGDDHDRPGARGAHVRRAARVAHARGDHRARAAATRILPTLGGQTALNLALELHDEGVLERLGVEMLGAQARRRSRRPRTARSSRRRWRRSASTCPRAGAAHSVEEAWRDRRRTRASRRSCGRRFTLGGSGGGIAYDAERVRREGRVGARAVADARGAHRGERPRVEGVRARGHARPGGQLHRRLLDREHRPDGRAHGRLDHRRAGDDAHRPRVPAPARRGARGHDRDWRRDGRRERAVRGRPEGRARSTSSR